MEIIILIALAAFVMGCLSRPELDKLSGWLFRKAALLTPDEKSKIRVDIFDNLENTPDGPNKIPMPYRREFVDEFMRIYIKTDDIRPADVLRILDKFHKDKPALYGFYNFLAGAYICRQVYYRHSDEWNKEKGV